MESRLASLKGGLKKMSASLKVRQKKWKKQRREVGKLVAQKFTHKMSETDKAGDVKFDHAKKELNLKTLMNAQATQSDAADAGEIVGISTDSKEMSGGERSFTTLVRPGTCTAASPPRAPLISLPPHIHYMWLAPGLR